MVEYKQGWIITPGAKGYDSELQVEMLFPVGIPVKIIYKTGDQVTVIEPHGKTVSFSANDIKEHVEQSSCWETEWERHNNPERHRWNIVDLIKKNGNNALMDWENSSPPCQETKDFFSIVLSTCKEYVQTDDLDLFNAVVDITLLILSDSDIETLPQDFIDATIFTVHSLLTCQSFVKSGFDWLNLDHEVWLRSLKPFEN